MNLSSWAVAALLLAPVTSAAAQAARSDPVLRPGDMLRLSVWRHAELSGDFLVAPDSTVVHPLYQRVQAAGVPFPVVTQRLRALLVTYEQGVEFPTQPLLAVPVAGEERRPTPYRLP